MGVNLRDSSQCTVVVSARSKRPSRNYHNPARQLYLRSADQEDLH